MFCDTGSLSASPDLEASLDGALWQADYLVLLASPASAASPWVAREVKTWQARDPELRHLLIGLTAGSMAWDGDARDVDWQVTDALPDCLRGAFVTEPRWVDFRELPPPRCTLDDPVFTDRVADIAATLHGRSKDDLVGDDVRQHRTVVRLVRTAVAVLTVLTAAALLLAVMAWRERNHARQQRDRATASAVAARANSRADDRPDRAILLALAALDQRPSTEARTALLRALERTNGTISQRFVPVGNAPIARLVIDHAGRYAATLDTSGTLVAVDLRNLHVVGRAAVDRRAADAGVLPQLMVTPDSDVVVVGLGGVDVRRLPTLRQRRSWRAPNGSVLVGPSPDGTVLAVTRSTEATVVDTLTGQATGPPTPLHNEVVVGFDADNRVRTQSVGPEVGLSAVRDEAGRVVTSASGVVISRDPGAPSNDLGLPVDTVMLSAVDAHDVIAATVSYESPGAVQLWVRSTKERYREPLRIGEGEITSLAFTPEERLVAGDTVGRLVVWTPNAPGRVRTTLEGSASTVAFSADGRRVAAATTEAVVVHDVASGAEVGRVPLGAMGVTAIALSPDGRVVATMGSDGTVERRSVVTGDRIGPALRGRVASSIAATMSVSSGGDVVVASTTPSSDPTAPIGRFTTDVLLFRWASDAVDPHRRSVARLTWTCGTGCDPPTFVEALSERGDQLAVGRPDGAVRVVTVTTGAVRRELVGDRTAVTAVSLDGNGQVAVAHESGRVELWGATGRRPRDVVAVLPPTRGPSPRTIASVAVLAGRTLAYTTVAPFTSTVGSSGWSVGLWDLAAQRPIVSVQETGGSRYGKVVASPSAVALAWAGGTGAVLWRLDDATLRRIGCEVAGGNLSADEWAREVGPLPYRKVCP